MLLKNGTAKFMDGLIFYVKKLPAGTEPREQIKTYAIRFGCNVDAIRPFGIYGAPPKDLPRPARVTKPSCADNE